MDIIGTRAVSKNPIVYINDGQARFTIEEILLKISNMEFPDMFFLFDNDLKLDFITVEPNVNASTNTETKISFHLYELTTEIGTGPEYTSSDILLMTLQNGAPGFNERYILS